LPENAAYAAAILRNIAAHEALARRMTHSSELRREQAMRNMFVAAAAVAGVLSAPIAAQAQNTVGVTGGNTVVIEQGGGIIADERPAFREYVVSQRVPAFTIQDRVAVGAVLPEAGVTYYDVPQRFGSTPFRYTVVNGTTVLVEPRSRRIVQVID
jgi:hypothetical protein